MWAGFELGGNKMTNKEAIETIKIAMAEVEWDYPMDYTVAFEMAVDALEKQATSEWIPCSERLPEIEKEVLVQWRPYLSSDIEMNILVLTKSGEWVCGLGRINGRAIAWMPLPEPYKDGERND